jgi:osmotically-inducible protein OsmY
MKVMYRVTLMMAAVALLAISVPVHASTMDDRIESTARDSYVFKTYLKGDDIKIQSRDGVVTLTGIVSEEYHKSLAQETVAGLPGVETVDNRLEVKGAPPTANSDEWLRDKVKVALLFHRSVSGFITEVNVKDGIVTVQGEATSQAQKDLTTEYAKDVEGVKGVNNEMTVTETSKTLSPLDQCPQYLGHHEEGCGYIGWQGQQLSRIESGHQTRQRRKRREGCKEPYDHRVRKEDHMLWPIAVILIALWLLGLVTSYTMGGFIHIMLVIAVIVVIVGFIQGRRG